ncbi:hypothetical protein [Flavobacterium sp. ZS1P14]|uniref:hypothetical protein n=1 Tax=Flavobacterium sp. ZS1P14 TaxID=3401729 RepID=UPI003AAAA119
MKKIFFILIAVSLLSISCSESSPCNDSYSNLIGTWIWESSSGGIAGVTETPASTGGHKKLVFIKEGRMISYNNNVETGNYSYEIRVGKSIYDGSNHYLIYAENEFSYVVLAVDPSNLKIGDNNYDGLVSSYKK